MNHYNDTLWTYFLLCHYFLSLSTFFTHLGFLRTSTAHSVISMFYDFLLASHTENRYYLKMICTVLLKCVASQTCFEQASIRWSSLDGRWGEEGGRGVGKSFSNFHNILDPKSHKSQLYWKDNIPLSRSSKGLVLLEFLSPLYDLPASRTNTTDH